MAHSVDFNSAGVIFIADYLNGRIHTYDPTGQFLGLFFDHPQSDDLAFAGPANAWFDPVGNLWVSDFDKHRIMKFGPDGNLIGWMGESEAGGPTLGFVTEGVAVSSPAPGGFCKPQMVRVDTEGLIYVVETGNHRIQRFGPDGTLRGWIGAAGDGTLTDGWSYAGTSIASALPGGLNEPVSLELTEDGMLLVADNGNHRLARFTLDGHFAGWIGGRAGGGTVTDWSLGGASASGSDPGQFRHPFDARVRAGRLYVADGHNGRVQILPWASATP